MALYMYIYVSREHFKYTGTTVVYYRGLCSCDIDQETSASNPYRPSFSYTPISIKVAPVNHDLQPALHYGKPFCTGKFSLFTFIEIMETICVKGVQESFQVKWLLRFLNMSELKNFIFKIS